MTPVHQRSDKPLSIDPLVEVIVGLLIVRRDQRPSWVKTYDDAREYAEAWAKRLRAKAVDVGV